MFLTDGITSLAVRQCINSISAIRMVASKGGTFIGINRAAEGHQARQQKVKRAIHVSTQDIHVFGIRCQISSVLGIQQSINLNNTPVERCRTTHD
jgi:hypothetical protein